MNELFTEMKRYTDERKELIRDLNFEQVKAFEERFDAIVMKGIEEKYTISKPQKQGTRGKNPKTKEQILNLLTDLRVPFENSQQLKKNQFM